ncbi:MAG: ABC transporter permease [Betaproteobacteria bacterium]|nr:ABC transporter permease [Betaproteobacteria bacterium]
MQAQSNDGNKSVADPEVHSLAAEDGGTLVRLVGAWDIRALETRARALQRLLKERINGDRWDLSTIQRLDHIGALLIWRAWNKQKPARLALRPEHAVFFDNLDKRAAVVDVAPRFDPLGPVKAVGNMAMLIFAHALDVLQLLGQMLIDTASMLRHPSRGPWREVSASIYRTGSQALGITAGVGFLIGVVLSYLSAEQLKAFGAGAFIVNILGIGIVRELGPVICAVLVAGRSGSAIAAQIGVMRVTEELDALSVMGIPHTVRLVLPKVVALSITLPLLVLWTSSIALVGGAVSAEFQLGIPVREFLSGLPAAVPTVNLWLGIGKGAIFGALIALVACHFGMKIQPNTESLGIGTTNSVVTSITAVIIADAFFAVLFNDVGIVLL